MEIIRTFNKLGKEDVSIAGGKGASLGEMTRAGIPVPEGFVVLSNAFEEFIEETDLNVEIDSILHKVKHDDINSVETASERIQSLILNSKIQKDIVEEVVKNYKKLGAKYVAVRSSATSEDSASAAWAGQLDSYLNTTEKSLLENIKKCWASLFTPRAIFYRIEKGLHKEKVSVAVVVQKMVESEVSGIAFSVHPVTQDKNQLIIEAGYGLGEAIVSGQITPDSYVVEKNPRRIIDRNITNQEKGLYRINNGGNEWKSVKDGNTQKLNDKEILELSELILKIEKHYGFPCDIEFAKEKGKFYIVQSRPITTLIDNINELNNKIQFMKTSTRDFSLEYVEVRHKGLVNLLNSVDVKLKNDKIFYVTYNENGLISSYLDPFVLEQAIKMFFVKIQGDKEFIKNFFDEFDRCIKKIDHFITKKNLKSKDELNEFIKIFTEANYYIPLAILLPTIDQLPKEVRDISMKYRLKSDKIVDYGDLLIINTVKLLHPEIEGFEKYITLEELKSNSLPLIKELRKRKKDYIFTNRLIDNIDLEKFGIENNINFEKDINDKNLDSLKGDIACNGKIRGKVKVILLKEEIDSIKKGEILVTTMTTPLFLPAMKKASAIITDEGGITCHAAIISRELKKPCVIGTKFASHTFKDGDFVEVDADNGVVRIIKKNEK